MARKHRQAAATATAMAATAATLAASKVATSRQVKVARRGADLLEMSLFLSPCLPGQWSTFHTTKLIYKQPGDESAQLVLQVSLEMNEKRR